MSLRRAAAAAGVALTFVAGCAGGGSRQGRASSDAATARHAQPAVRAAPDALVRRRVVLGGSVDHRPVAVVEVGDPDSPRRVLVVGCIHGNEPAGIAVARALAASTAPPEVDLWIVTDLNPDGVARHRRGNAHGVDLNRNFPYRWRPLGPPGSTYYAGPGALSEPESRLAAALLRRVRPTLGIWYHQALGVVDSSQGPLRLERRYAALSGLPLRRLTDYPGSATGYEDQLLGASAFVVELPGGALTRAQVLRHARAVLSVAASAPPNRA